MGHCKLEWVRTPDTVGTTPHTWVVRTSEKQIIEGRSDGRATEFTAKSPGDPAAQRPAASPALSVLILRDNEHAADARYVEAALRAAADSIGQPVNVQNREITPDVDNAAVTDWTFWLSTRAVPEGLAARAPRIVRYVGSETMAADGWIDAPPGEAADGARLWKLATPSTPLGAASVVWWSDGRGNPVLTYSHPAVGERWELSTRFDPGWTDLPDTTALPAWLRTLLFPQVAAWADADPIHDRRLADPAQSLPSKNSAAAKIETLAPADQPSRDLHWPLWTLAALLFAAERILSLRRSIVRTIPAPVFRPEFTTAETR